MNRRSWVLLGAIMLFAGLLVYTLRGGGGRREAGTLLEDAFWQEDRAAVARLEVEGADGSRLVIERSAREPEPVPYQPPERFRESVTVPFESFTPPGPQTEWWITEPRAMPADPSRVSSLLFTLVEPRPQERASEGEEAQAADLEVFGLDPPRATVRLEVEGEEGRARVRELHVGDPTPLRSSTGDPQSYYVAVPGRAGVYTLSAYPIETVFEGAAGMRLLQFARFEPNDVVRMRLLWDGKPPVSLARTGETWRVEGPEPAPADGARVQDLLYDLSLLRAEEVVHEDATDEELAMTGLHNPRGEVVVWLGARDAGTEPEEAADETAPLARVLWVGDFLPDGSGVYVRLASERTIYRVRGERLQSFFDVTARPVSLAQRGLMPEGWERGPAGSIERIVWERESGTAVAERGEDGSWSGVEDVAALLQSLAGFRATEVVAVGPAATDEAGWRPGDPLPEGARRLTLEPEAGSRPPTPVVVTRLPGEETARGQVQVRLLWQSGEDLLLLRADPAAWSGLEEYW